MWRTSAFPYAKIENNRILTYNTPYPDTHPYPVPYTCTLHITLENPRIYCPAHCHRPSEKARPNPFFLSIRQRTKGTALAVFLSFCSHKRNWTDLRLAERIGSCLAAPTTVGGTVQHRSLQEYCTMKMDSSFIGWPPPTTARLAKTVHSTARRPAHGTA